MNIYKNNSVGTLKFGRFKLAAGETVPAVPYTETEEKDIARFVTNGILVLDGAKAEEPAVEVPVEAPKVEEPAAEAPVEEPVAKRAPKKEKQA